MQTRKSQLFSELCRLIGELGKDGGKISPSIYDTAQRVRFYPPAEGTEPILDWLLEEQQADGGWGDPAVPTARDASSLAAILALHHYRTDRATQNAVEAGLAFLHTQAAQWADIHLDALPIAAEMILPRLLEEAQAQNLISDLTPYRRLFELRTKKQKYISNDSLQAASASTYSWEALKLPVSEKWLDTTGGVGHSPAATAKWLQLAADKPELAEYRARAEDYLQRAHRATDSAIPGVVPVVYPITGFELSYGGFALLSHDLLRQPELQECVLALAAQINAELHRQGGYTFGEGFEPDADSTAVAMAILAALGQPTQTDHLLQFEKPNGFATFHQELNASILSNAHALCALAEMGHSHPAAETFLLERQRTSGEWYPDKWHSSWLYSTLESTIALTKQRKLESIQNVMETLITGQHADGGWGTGLQSTLIESSYAMLALKIIQKYVTLSEPAQDSLEQGWAWLNRRDAAPDQAKRWLGKELYRSRRVDRMYELCALVTGNASAGSESDPTSRNLQAASLVAS